MTNREKFVNVFGIAPEDMKEDFFSKEYSNHELDLYLLTFKALELMAEDFHEMKYEECHPDIMTATYNVCETECGKCKECGDQFVLTAQYIRRARRVINGTETGN